MFERNERISVGAVLDYAQNAFSLVRDMSQENMVRVYWREVVRFLDEKCPKNVGHVTGVVGVLGEDLGAAAFKHCVEANRLGRVGIHDGRVKDVGLMGPWLDRWIEVNSEGWGDLLFQAEVKSSSAYATLGKTLSIETGGDELVVRKRAAWRNEWDDTARCLKYPATGKVLVRMTPTEDFGQRRQVPLLIFWRALAPDFDRGFISRVAGDHLFSVERPEYGVRGRVPRTWPAEQENFDELWVFSVSSYLRSLEPKEYLDLDMPNAVSRWRAMNAMCKPLGRQSLGS